MGATYRRRGLTIIELLIILAIIGIMAALIIPIAFGGGGRDAKRAAAIRAAETFGFTGIQLNDPSSGCASSSGCGKDDAYAFLATAVNQADRRVSFVICCGRGPKGCTVRTR